jgi:hypothetical protein
MISKPINKINECLGEIDAEYEKRYYDCIKIN